MIVRTAHLKTEGDGSRVLEARFKWYSEPHDTWVAASLSFMQEGFKAASDGHWEKHIQIGSIHSILPDPAKQIGTMITMAKEVEGITKILTEERTVYSGDIKGYLERLGFAILRTVCSAP